MKRLIALAAAVGLCGTGLVAKAYDVGEMSDEYRYFDKVSGYAAEMYIDETLTKEDVMQLGLNKLLKNNPELVDEILKAGFSSLDNYSDFYTYSEFKSYVNDLNHTFYGIGVVIQKDGDYVKIVRCLDGGSAVEAGIKGDDKIIRVDGVNAVGETLDTVQAMVVGELGTEVSITVLRGSEEYTYTMQRRPVSNETVGYAMLEGNVAYIEILNFALTTADEFNDTLDELKGMGVKNIILDLRDNPGGYLRIAVDMAKRVVPKGVIVQTMYRQEEYNQTFYSDLEDTEFEFVVLVNENTASAAEILSAAMAESGAATLVGERTFGKALIQEMINLPDGCAFKLTTGKYLTRNGVDINKVGITPEYEIANPKQKITTSRYTQFDYTTKWRTGETGDGVKAAKQRLRLLGYEISSIDNFFDDELAAAVSKFQADEGLFPYGVLDRTTQVRMENKFAELDETVDMQLITAYKMFGGTEEDLYK